MGERGVRNAEVGSSILLRSTILPSSHDAQAAGWFRRAAEKGSALAMASLAVVLHEGIGVAKDPAQAVTWYRRASEKGYAPAMVKLGNALARGDGVALDVFSGTGTISILLSAHFRRIFGVESSPDAISDAVRNADLNQVDNCEFVQGEDNLLRYKVPDARYFMQVFCKTCGSKMPRLDPGRGIAVIPFGSLDDDPGALPSRHIYVDDMARWYEITDDLPQYEQWPSGFGPGR